jgi:hypothetical protein
MGNMKIEKSCCGFILCGGTSIVGFVQVVSWFRGFVVSWFRGFVVVVNHGFAPGAFVASDRTPMEMRTDMIIGLANGRKELACNCKIVGKRDNSS